MTDGLSGYPDLPFREGLGRVVGADVGETDEVGQVGFGLEARLDLSAEGVQAGSAEVADVALDVSFSEEMTKDRVLVAEPCSEAAISPDDVSVVGQDVDIHDAEAAIYGPEGPVLHSHQMDLAAASCLVDLSIPLPDPIPGCPEVESSDRKRVSWDLASHVVLLRSKEKGLKHFT